MPDEIDFSGAEVAPHCFEVFDIVMETSLALCGVGDSIGAPAIPEVEKNERATGSEALEVIEQINPVREKHSVWAAAHDPKEQANSVWRG
jgi:hypothetical protein